MRPLSSFLVTRRITTMSASFAGFAETITVSVAEIILPVRSSDFLARSDISYKLESNVSTKPDKGAIRVAVVLNGNGGSGVSTFNRVSMLRTHIHESCWTQEQVVVAFGFAVYHAEIATNAVLSTSPISPP